MDASLTDWPCLRPPSPKLTALTPAMQRAGERGQLERLTVERRKGKLPSAIVATPGQRLITSRLCRNRSRGWAERPFVPYSLVNGRLRAHRDLSPWLVQVSLPNSIPFGSAHVQQIPRKYSNSTLQNTYTPVTSGGRGKQLCKAVAFIPWLSTSNVEHVEAMRNRSAGYSLSRTLPSTRAAGCWG